MNNLLKKILVALVALGILAALVFVVVPYVKEKRSGSYAVGEKQPAPQGELTKDYPPALVPTETNVALEESYSVKDEKGAIEKTSAFTAERSVKDIYDEYLKLLEDNGFRIINKSISDTEANIYGNKPGESDVSVNIYKEADGRVYFSVSYLDK